MTWGPLYMYYRCAGCGVKYKYELDMLGHLGDTFGKCPTCGADGVFVKEGPIMTDDNEYIDAE